MRDLNYSNFFEKGEIKISEALEYNSHNTIRLDINEIKKLLLKLRFFQNSGNSKHFETDD